MRMKRSKDLYSTGDIARICGVTINTVVKWFETGELKGRRTSKTGARRITRKNLFSFLKRQGFPPDTASREKYRIVVVDNDKTVISTIKKAFRHSYGCTVDATASNFEAGLLTSRLKPDIVFLNVNLKGVEAKKLLKLVRAGRDARKIHVVAITRRLGKQRREEMSRHFDAVLAQPLEVGDIKKLMAACTS
jgi:CheY-like chemotaxis protein